MSKYIVLILTQILVMVVASDLHAGVISDMNDDHAMMSVPIDSNPEPVPTIIESDLVQDVGMSQSSGSLTFTGSALHARSTDIAECGIVFGKLLTENWLLPLDPILDGIFRPS